MPPDDLERRIQAALAARPGVGFGSAEADQLIQAKTRRIETLIRQLQGGVVTSLPTKANAGSRAVFQTEAMAAMSPPVAWELFYDGAKWIPLGGPALYDYTASFQRVSNTSEQAVTGATLTIPVAGDYMGMFAGDGQASGAAAQLSLVLSKNGTRITDSDGVQYVAAATFQGRIAHPGFLVTGLAAGDTLGLLCGSNVVGTHIFRRIVLMAKPVRLG